MKKENIPEGFAISNLSIMDEIGMVLLSKKKVLRAIRHVHQNNALELFDSGLIDELVQQGLFPETKIANLEIEGYPLILEHKKISPMVYPYEWSPEMLRRAALSVLNVNKCANAYGYELKDAHPYNIVFSFGKAIFVDFGSLVKRKSPDSWVAYGEFINCYCRVLSLAEKGLRSFFKHAFLISGRGFRGGEMAVAVSPFYSLIGMRISNIVLNLANNYHMGPVISEDAIAKRFPNPAIRFLARFILYSRLLPFRNTNSLALEKKIKSFRFENDTEWGDYHRQVGFYAQDGSINLTSRMKWVIDTVDNLSPSTVLELAGNQGVLSRALSKLPGVDYVICADSDEKSIDQLLIRLDDEDKVHPACFDFMADVQGSLSAERVKRFKSDVVIALAVTHHLILTQRYSIESIFAALASYTNRYLIVEFMPMGLWDGETAPPVPDWYKESWFSENMSKHFKIINRVALEDNRIVFVGEI